MGCRDARDDTGSVGPAAPVRFPGPFEVELPPGAEGWDTLYPYSLPFSEDRRPYEDSVFWFRETIHWPRPLRPFEATFFQDALVSLGQFNHRHYVMPTARGLDFRILHGYCYLSPGSIDDPEVVAERSVAFAERAGHYYEHWDELYEGWMARIRDVLARIEALSFPLLPERVAVSEVISGDGKGPTFHLTQRFHTLLDLGVELWQAHFEFLNLGYAAYLDYFQFCRSELPEVSELDVARMVAGIDVDLFRPDQELRRLARSAVDLGIDAALAHCGTGELAGLADLPGGRAWLDDFERTQERWFNYSSGSGFYADDRVWADHLEVPLAYIGAYVEQLRGGHPLESPRERVADERDRLAAAARARLDDERRDVFEAKLALARTVYHFVENHNFYIEHWGMSVLWRRVRELSALFVKEGFWPSVDDIFLLRPDEVESALWDALGAWANGAPARGPQRWPAEVRRREQILEACAAHSPPPALGVVPELVTEPFTVMLWGITTASLVQRAPTPRGEVLVGLPVSCGVVEGRARVVAGPDGLDQVCDGEVLVAEFTSPSWMPVFARIVGTVTEAGGVMSHAAIVCREYGLPAVAGVAGATTTIRTGDLVRVDGTSGTVTVIG
jgi:pyruvate,water dikinase